MSNDYLLGLGNHPHFVELLLDLLVGALLVGAVALELFLGFFYGV